MAVSAVAARAPQPLLATVSVLNGGRPLALAAGHRRLQHDGRLAVFSGAPQRARRLAAALGRRGFTTSVNLQAG